LTAVLRGVLETFESRDGQEQILVTAGPRVFIGDGAMLLGTAALANARGKADESEILEVPADRLRQALAELPGLGETIFSTKIMSRTGGSIFKANTATPYANASTWRVAICLP
jgi:thioredoxin reductase (NADPH)